ncbi:MAG TPA: 30S ribosomal protein S16 [bacterium]|nr:30S ribosomal protein S16 [bacterium]
MEVRLRLKLIGKKKKPIFRIVAQPRGAARDGKSLDILGIYDPAGKTWAEKVNLDLAKLDSWIARGARMSETVERLSAHIRPKKTAAEKG